MARTSPHKCNILQGVLSMQHFLLCSLTFSILRYNTVLSCKNAYSPQPTWSAQSRTTPGWVRSPTRDPIHLSASKIKQSQNQHENKIHSNSHPGRTPLDRRLTIHWVSGLQLIIALLKIVFTFLLSHTQCTWQVDQPISKPTLGQVFYSNVGVNGSADVAGVP